MLQILCECGWDIPGVSKLPPHSHVTLRHVVSDRFDGWVPGVLPSPGYEIVDEREDLVFPVDWKRYAHELAMSG